MTEWTWSLSAVAVASIGTSTDLVIEVRNSHPCLRGVIVPTH